MYLNNETGSLHSLVNLIYSSADTIISSFQQEDIVSTSERVVKWNSNNHPRTILNVDVSCNKTPIPTGFGGVVCNNADFFLFGFSGLIPHSTDILLVELSAIHHGFRLAINMGFEDVACYSNSLILVNLITGDVP